MTPKPTLVHHSELYADSVTPDESTEPHYADWQVADAYRSGFFRCKSVVCNYLRVISQGAPNDDRLKQLVEKVKQLGIDTWEL